MEHRYFEDTVLGRFIKMVKCDHQRVEIITRNGYHMFGYITDADERALLVEVEGTDRLVVMASVSTIIPREKKEARGDVG